MLLTTRRPATTPAIAGSVALGHGTGLPVAPPMPTPAGACPAPTACCNAMEPSPTSAPALPKPRWANDADVFGAPVSVFGPLGGSGTYVGLSGTDRAQRDLTANVRPPASVGGASG